MNTYQVTATRESDGKEVSDKFSGPTEGAARKDFRECYRHDNYTITGVELISTGTPATKDQEREALAKIKKLVDSLGADGYVATAFRGVFEIAEQNIENDFADNPVEARDVAWEELKQAKATTESAKAELKRLEAMVGRLGDELENAKEWAAEQNERLNNATTAREEAQAAAQEAEAEKQAAEQQVVELKAKLYDYMASKN